MTVEVKGAEIEVSRPDDKKENIKAGRHAGFLSSYVKPNHIEDNRDYKALLAELKKNN